MLVVLSFSDRLLAQINIDSSGQRKRHHQRRRHQIIRANFRIDSAFEVAIARKHRRHHQIFVFDRARYFGRQRPRIADASRAAITHEMKFQLLQIRQQTSRLQIVGHHFRSGRERSLHPGRDRQTFLDSFFCQQSRGDQNGRIRGIRTRSNRCDDDAPMLD